jgi:hypothetical protein
MNNEENCPVCKYPLAGNGICPKYSTHRVFIADDNRVQTIRFKAESALKNTPTSPIAGDIIWLCEQLQKFRPVITPAMEFEQAKAAMLRGEQ